jgi:hypothetical protein
MLPVYGIRNGRHQIVSRAAAGLTDTQMMASGLDETLSYRDGRWVRSHYSEHCYDCDNLFGNCQACASKR